MTLVRGRMFSPGVDIREAKDAYVVKVDVPGVRDADLAITVKASAITIAGRRDPEADADGEQVHLRERGHGPFTRTFTLADGADMDGVTADLDHGVLTLRIPKRAAAAAKPRKVSVGDGALAISRPRTYESSQKGDRHEEVSGSVQGIGGGVRGGDEGDPGAAEGRHGRVDGVEQAGGEGDRRHGRAAG